MAVGVRLTVDAASLARAGKAIASAGEDDARALLRARGTSILLSGLKEAAPVRSGRLRQSIIAYQQGGGVGFWGLAYGRYVAQGTRPHVIRARQGRVLAFGRGGQVVFARQVRHPGTRPNDFPRRAAQQAEPELRAVLRAAGGGRIAGIVERSR